MLEPKTKNVTIKTVADLAGVSIKTVSRVLNDEPGVKKSTREKVQAAIHKLNYQPSPAAQALAANQSKIIGLVYENISASYTLRMQNGALKTCYAEDYNLVIHPCHHKSETLIDELVDLVTRSRLNGLILVPPICDDFKLLQALNENKIPFVRIAPAQKFENSYSVSSNDAVAVENIITQLIEQGHKDIGFIKGHEHHGATQERFKGYLRALEKFGIKLNSEFVCDGNFSFESGKAAGEILLSKKKRPSAIFAANDYMAAGLMYVANEKGINVPEQLSIIGFDNAPVSHQISPMITTVKQPIEEMSAAAAQILINISKQRTVQNEHEFFNAELILRESHKTFH